MIDTKGKVLIIDDELDICFLLGNILRKDHWKTDYSNSLAEAFAFIRKNQYDIVFLDLNLPDGSGMDFISLIKTFQKNAKIVVISAYDTSEERKVAAKKGVDQFLGKPFNEQLIRRIVN